MLTVCKITGHFGTQFRNCAEDCLSLEVQVLTLWISYSSVLKTLWNAAVGYFVSSSLFPMQKSECLCFSNGWLHQPITQLVCRTGREGLCVVQAALSQSHTRQGLLVICSLCLPGEQAHGTAAEPQPEMQCTEQKHSWLLGKIWACNLVALLFCAAVPLGCRSAGHSWDAPLHLGNAPRRDQ